MGEAERGESAPRRRISFWCANGHETRPSFASDAVIPESWDCPRCGLPAGPDRDVPPTAPRTEPYKTHLAYVRERRNDADGEAILAEALERLRTSKVYPRIAASLRVTSSPRVPTVRHLWR